MKNYQKSFLLDIICLIITLVILISGLWPFNFISGNKVEWLRDMNGIRFYGQGIVFSQEPLVIQKAVSKNASVTIELLVRPHKESNHTVTSILTLYDRDREQLIFGQWETHLVIRVPASADYSNKCYHEIVISNALTKNVTHFLTVVLEKGTTNIYVDGKLEKSVPHYSLFPEDHKFSGYLLLGNSPEGKHSWYGDIQGLALYDRILSSKEACDHYTAWQKGDDIRPSEENKPIALYMFDEHRGEQIRDQSSHRNHLWMPASFYPLRRTILGLPQKAYWFSSSNLTDVTINILGFVPFGVFFSAWLLLAKKYSVLCSYSITILLGFCLSLGIELVQVYLPARDSSLFDVFSNTIGTIAGVLLLRHALSKHYQSKS